MIPKTKYKIKSKKLKATHADMIPVDETIEIQIPKPQTELEFQLARRLGWGKYFFQFPLITKYVVKQIKRLNVDVGEIEYIPIKKAIKHEEIRNNRSAWSHFDENQRNELQVRFTEYTKYVKLPLDFKKQFPFLWAIIQDQYITNLVNSRNLVRMKRKLKGLIKLNIDYSTIIFYQHYLIKQMPNYNQALNDDPFLKMFMENVDNLMKIIYTKGMQESTFNELVQNTIEATKSFKVRK